MDNRSSSFTFGINDWQFAPVGTFTDDYDWRFTLEKGNIIDALDDEKDWYKSTILDTRMVKNVEGTEIKEIYVGFRTYEEEGSKEDDDGRKFFGWSSKYDTWYSVTDLAV